MSFSNLECFGVITGFIGVQHTTASVGMIFAMTAPVMFALAFLTITMTNDPSGVGPFFLVLLMGIFMKCLTNWFFPCNPFREKVICIVAKQS